MNVSGSIESSKYNCRSSGCVALSFERKEKKRKKEIEQKMHKGCEG